MDVDACKLVAADPGVCMCGRAAAAVCAQRAVVLRACVARPYRCAWRAAAARAEHLPRACAAPLCYAPCKTRSSLSPPSPLSSLPLHARKAAACPCPPPPHRLRPCTPPQALADYVGSVDPEQYSTIFKTQLDSTCVSHVLRGLQRIVKVRPRVRTCAHARTAHAACSALGGPVHKGAHRGRRRKGGGAW